MENNRIYTILILLIICSLSTLIFNRIYIDHFDNYSLVLDIQLIGLAIVVFIILISFLTNKLNLKSSKFILIFTSAIFVLGLFPFYKSLERKKRIDFIKQYSSLDCNKLIKRFEYDKTKNKFAYFSYGLGVNQDAFYKEFKEEYNVEVIAIGMGCLGSAKTHCYNIELMNYLDNKKNRNGSI